MARKHNLDKVSNHIMLETDLSEKDRDKLLDVVEAQINQNNDEQRRNEAKQKSKSSKSLLQMARENRIIKG
ncbi:putative membrane protein YukC [Staphylococcus hominis]